MNDRNSANPNSFKVQVPEHLDQGVTVRVDTRTGEYLGRAG
jgi:Elongation factor P, C-terminal